MNPWGVPILSLSESQQLERQLLADCSREREALYKAGNSLGRAIEQDFLEIRNWPVAPSVLLLAGKGHNTGDALLAIEHLFVCHPKMQVTVLWEGERNLRPLVHEIWQRLKQSSWASQIDTLLLSKENQALHVICARNWTLTIDAVFGMGFRPPLPESWQRVAEALREPESVARFGVRVAVDLPSGLSSDCTNTEPLIFADFTYAMGIAKEPLFLESNLQYCGRIRFLDIGFFEGNKWGSQTGFTRSNAESEIQSAYRGTHNPDPIGLEVHATPTPKLIVSGVLEPLRISRKVTDDKRHHGRVGIVAGSLRYPGAALLTTLGALKAGAGLVTSVVPENLIPSFSAQAPEAIWMGASLTPAGTISLEMLRDILAAAANWETLVIGPGISRDEETFCLVQELISGFKGRVVIDADALRPELLPLFKARPTDWGEIVLLPHAGEWQRLSGTTTNFAAGVAEQTCACQWAREHRVVLVRKGALTRITDGECEWISSRGGPVLGRGGSGDILAGMLGALLARFSKKLPARQIAAMAVFWQGKAAEALAAARGENALRNQEFLDYLAPALRDDSV